MTDYFSTKRVDRERIALIFDASISRRGEAPRPLSCSKLKANSLRIKGFSGLAPSKEELRKNSTNSYKITNFDYIQQILRHT